MLLRRALASLLILMLVLVAAGCGSGAPGSTDGDDEATEDKPQELVLLSYGGPWDDLTAQYVAEPFTQATGIEVVIMPGSDDLIGAVLSQKDNPQYDMILTGYEDYVFLKNGGALDPVDYNDMPNTADLYPIAEASHGVATSITGVTLVYNTEKISEPPTSWLDLWKPEYADHVAIPKLPQTYGIDFLVMVARALGGGEDDIEPAFAKLEELKPNLGAIYESSSHAAQLFQQGDIWVAPWYSGRTASTRASGVPVDTANPEEGSVVYLTMLSPLKGRYNKWVAQFMDMYMADEVQQAFARDFASGPSRMSVQLDDEVAATVPYGEEEVAELLQLDWDTILSRRDEWTDRFIREIAGR